MTNISSMLPFWITIKHPYTIIGSMCKKSTWKPFIGFAHCVFSMHSMRWHFLLTGNLGLCNDIAPKNRFVERPTIAKMLFCNDIEKKSFGLRPNDIALQPYCPSTPVSRKRTTTTTSKRDVRRMRDPLHLAYMVCSYGFSFFEKMTPRRGASAYFDALSQCCFLRRPDAPRGGI